MAKLIKLRPLKLLVNICKELAGLVAMVTGGHLVHIWTNIRGWWWKAAGVLLSSDPTLRHLHTSLFPPAVRLQEQSVHVAQAVLCEVHPDQHASLSSSSSVGGEVSLGRHSCYRDWEESQKKRRRGGVSSLSASTFT